MPRKADAVRFRFEHTWSWDNEVLRNPKGRVRGLSIAFMKQSITRPRRAVGTEIAL